MPSDEERWAHSKAAIPTVISAALIGIAIDGPTRSVDWIFWTMAALAAVFAVLASRA